MSYGRAAHATESNFPSVLRAARRTQRFVHHIRSERDDRIGFAFERDAVAFSEQVRHGVIESGESRGGADCFQRDGEPGVVFDHGGSHYVFLRGPPCLKWIFTEYDEVEILQHIAELSADGFYIAGYDSPEMMLLRIPLRRLQTSFTLRAIRYGK